MYNFLIVTGRFLILRKIKYQEADLIIHALSEQGGKSSFMARSALKSKKRFGGGALEPAQLVHLTYKVAKSSEQMHTLQEAQVLQDFKNIRRSYEHLELALVAVDCVQKVSQEGEQHSEGLFNLLGHCLKAIEKNQNVLNLKLHFYLKFLWQQGVLTPEDWMKIYLKTPLASSDDLQVSPLDLARIPWLENIVQNYLKTASV
ncbi:MAG: DNA repair protein RecO [Pseudobdellovibrionaceae bacterium]